MSKNKLKIGLDFHGVISEDVPFFREFTQKAIERGHEVHIITGGPESYVRDFLNKENIKFTTIFAIMDYYKAKGEGKYVQGEFFVHDDIWDNSKSRYCREHGIDFHIDDRPSFQTEDMTFCQYDDKHKRCKIEDADLFAFSGDADKVLDDIEQFVKSHPKL